MGRQNRPTHRNIHISVTTLVRLLASRGQEGPDAFGVSEKLVGGNVSYEIAWSLDLNLSHILDYFILTPWVLEDNFSVAQ